MKELPLLPSDFKYFSWEEPIGEATTIQLQMAYNAILTAGKTTEFSRFVWNDMVELLYQALTQSKLGWDSTYGSADETKIPELYGTLTARRFNAMTINIDQLINYSWRWEINTHVLGYLGRPRFYGIAEKKDKGDLVYGWYLMELARVLNVFIAVLKNEADFAEFNIKNISNTPTNVTLLPRISAPMFYAKSSTTNKNVNLLSRKSRPMYVSLYSSSNIDVELIKKAVRRLTIKHLSKSVTNTKLDPKQRIRTSSQHLLYSQHDVTMTDKLSKGFRQYEKNIKTIVEAAISFYGCVDMFLEKLHKSIDQSFMDMLPPWTFNVEELSKSNSIVTASNVGSHSFGDYLELIHSSNQSEMYNALSKQIAASNVQSFSKHDTNIDTSLVQQVESSNNQLFSVYEAEMLHKESKTMDSSSILNSKYLVEPNVSRPLFFGSIDISTSKDEVHCSLSLHNLLEADVISKSVVFTDLSSLATINLEIESKSNTNSEVEMIGSKMLELGANVTSQSIVKSVLGFDDIIIDDEWVVQNENNLYIRQAWLTWQEETKGYIDIPIWYQPKQEGSNLYIRSAWESGVDENDVYIDSVVWYKPKQNGTDLYIQTVDRFWNDEENGNIDTDVFFEPIQEESNLYIRQLESLEGSDE